MKVLSLGIEGFGPYRGKQHIDFTEFDGDGLFVITGKTGAGKSTILDAICFALYGEVPRYEKTDKSLRSDFCGDEDPTSVTLEFEVGNLRYKIWRSPDYERAKKRGAGTTTKQAEAELHEWMDGGWKALEVKPREVGRRVLGIMQLTCDQFLQVILLAQGRFAEFLQTGTAERLKVLRSLFDTGRFERLEHHVREVAKAREHALQEADLALSALVERAVSLASDEAPERPQLDAWFASQAEHLDAKSRAAGKARARASKAADTAAATLTEAESVELKRARLGNARAILAELEAKSEDHERDFARLEAAKRAQPVRAPLAAHSEALEALADATTDVEVCVAGALASQHIDIAWPSELGPLTAAKRSVLKSRLAEIAGVRGSLDEALAIEAKLEHLAAQHLLAEQALESSKSSRDELTKEIAGAPAALKEIKDNLAGSIAALAKLPALEKDLASARVSLDAHETAVTLTGQLDTLRAAEGTVSSKNLVAVERHDELIQRRLHGEAARLAEHLSDGEQCPVCGSTEHPSPATPAATTVSDDQVEAARLQVDATSKALTEATTAVLDLSAKLTECISKAVGTQEEATEIFAAAERLVIDTRTLADTRARWDRELETHEEAIEAKRQALARASEEVTAASTELAAAANNLKAAQDTVERSRQVFESVAERVNALDEARDSLNAVATANEEQDQATKALSSARRALDVAIAEGGFVSVEEASEALLNPGELATLAAQVDAFAANRAGAQAVVKELSAEVLPPQVADLDALREADENAKKLRDESVETHTIAARVAIDFAALRAEYGSATENTAIARQQRDLATALANTLEGRPPNDRRIRLESFVLAAKLERIVAAANARLVTMSSNQYRLEYDDGRQHRNIETGLGLRVFDAHTGRSRSTHSLSGGETFLASLALALGLAETVTAEAGGIQLNTLFVDEGFGSLDGDTLEVAMATLDNLRTGGRTVGLISHVEAMKEAIPAKLEVAKERDGSSFLRTISGR